MIASTLLHHPSTSRARTDALEVKPCFGVACQVRASCACYEAVEDAPGGATTRVTCLCEGGYLGYRPCGRRGIGRLA